MLKELRIKNFKGWEDTGVIKMAPITLLFGANSSGKSSIGQFLMMLKQTVESPDRKAVFYPGGKNSAVHLGSYQEMVFHRNSANKIAFDYQWVMPELLEIEDRLHQDQEKVSGNILSFSAETGLSVKDKNTPVLHSLCYKILHEDKVKLSIVMKRKSDTSSDYEVEYPVEGYELTRRQGRVWPLGAPVRFYGFPDEVVAYHQNADFVQTLNLEHEKLFRNLYYLGPLRTKAERLYSWTGIEPDSVGYEGENTVAAILAAENRKISFAHRRRKKPFQESIAIKLKEMGLIEEFKVKPITKQRQDYEVKVCTKGSRDWVDLPDVGFGISQVLPVLVQCFYAPPRSIIIMEQPEIHLHPSAQSALADVMIDAINSRENGADRNIQLIIETHSEHFLRRLQRRIAEDRIPKEKVSAYFANITRTPATLDPLEINLFGNIKNWPENFFGDEMEDIIEQSKAAMGKRTRENEGKAEESE
ncbi:MAG: DUF3696 domain-containing protein [Candidatus Dadabacteria bacterium]|nr:DUF3696 domain-containing protein [Candidatus Dadabacteria bacterium]